MTYYKKANDGVENYRYTIEGNKEKMKKLGDCYKYGWGVEKNAREAVKWYKYASDPSAFATMPVYDTVPQMPSFPGGSSALFNYLSANIKYPLVCEENGIQGRVICSFIVEPDGSLSELKVVKSVHVSLDKEALRLLRSMPSWTPGQKDGAAVRVRYTVPITFRLQ